MCNMYVRDFLQKLCKIGCAEMEESHCLATTAKNNVFSVCARTSKQNTNQSWHFYQNYTSTMLSHAKITLTCTPTSGDFSNSVDEWLANHFLTLFWWKYLSIAMQNRTWMFNATKRMVDIFIEPIDNIYLDTIFMGHKNIDNKYTYTMQ